MSDKQTTMTDDAYADYVTSIATSDVTSRYNERSHVHVGRTNKHTNKRTNERTNQRTNQQTNHRKNKPIDRPRNTRQTNNAHFYLDSNAAARIKLDIVRRRCEEKVCKFAPNWHDNNKCPLCVCVCDMIDAVLAVCRLTWLSWLPDSGQSGQSDRRRPKWPRAGNRRRVSRRVSECLWAW